MAPIAARADVILHTSDMSVHELKRIVTRHFTGGERGARMMVELISFGFRHGLPETADLMVDVRFLPNPFFEDELLPGADDDGPVGALAVLRFDALTIEAQLEVDVRDMIFVDDEVGPRQPANPEGCADLEAVKREPASGSLSC